MAIVKGPSGAYTVTNIPPWVVVSVLVVLVVLVAALGCCCAVFLVRRGQDGVSRKEFEDFGKQVGQRVGQVIADSREQSSEQAASLLAGFNQALQGQERVLTTIESRLEELVSSAREGADTAAAGQDDDTIAKSPAVSGAISKITNLAEERHQQGSALLRQFSQTIGQLNMPHLIQEIQSTIRSEIRDNVWNKLNRFEQSSQAVLDEVKRSAGSNGLAPATIQGALDRLSADQHQTRRELIEYQHEQQAMNSRHAGEQSELCTIMTSLSSQMNNIEAALSESLAAVPVAHPSSVSSAPGPSGQVPEEPVSEPEPEGPGSNEHVREEEGEGEKDGEGNVDRKDADKDNEDRKDGPEDGGDDSDEDDNDDHPSRPSVGLLAAAPEASINAASSPPPPSPPHPSATSSAFLHLLSAGDAPLPPLRPRSPSPSSPPYTPSSPVAPSSPRAPRAPGFPSSSPSPSPLPPTPSPAATQAPSHRGPVRWGSSTIVEYEVESPYESPSHQSPSTTESAPEPQFESSTTPASQPQAAAAEPQSNASSQPDVLPIPAGVGTQNFVSSRNNESEDSGNGSSTSGDAALGPVFGSMTGVVNTGGQTLAPPVPTETAMEVDPSTDLGAAPRDHDEVMDDVDNDGDVEMSSSAQPSASSTTQQPSSGLSFQQPAAGNDNAADRMDVEPQNPGSRVNEGAQPMEFDWSLPNVLFQSQPAARSQTQLPTPLAPTPQQSAGRSAQRSGQQRTSAMPRPTTTSTRSRRPVQQRSAPGSVPSAPAPAPAPAPVPALPPLLSPSVSGPSLFAPSLSFAPSVPSPSPSVPSFVLPVLPSAAPRPNPAPAQGAAPQQPAAAEEPKAGSDDAKSDGGSDISDLDADELAEATKVAKATIADAEADDNDAALRDLEEGLDELEGEQANAPAVQSGPPPSSAAADPSLPFDPRPRDNGTIQIEGGEIDLYVPLEQDLTPRDPASIGAVVVRPTSTPGSTSAPRPIARARARARAPGRASLHAAVAGPSSSSGSGSTSAPPPPAPSSSNLNADLDADVLRAASILSGQPERAPASSADQDEAFARQLASAEARSVDDKAYVQAQVDAAKKIASAFDEPWNDPDTESVVSEENGSPKEPMPRFPEYVDRMMEEARKGEEDGKGKGKAPD